MDWAWSGVCGLGVALFVGLWVRAWREDQRKARVAKRRTDYDAALSYVTEHPWDADARVACLNAGRQYYDLAHPDAPIDQAGLTRDALIQSDISARLGRTRDRSPRLYRFARAVPRPRGSWGSARPCALTKN